MNKIEKKCEWVKKLLYELSFDVNGDEMVYITDAEKIIDKVFNSKVGGNE